MSSNTTPNSGNHPVESSSSTCQFSNRDYKRAVLIAILCILAFLQIAISQVKLQESSSFIQEKSSISIQEKIERKTLASTLEGFEWDRLLTGNEEEKLKYWGQLLKYVNENNIMEPYVPVNETCQAPELPPPLCVSKGVFTGEVRQEPVKVGHAIQLGFDVDVLEIHLNEIYDVVDKIFIIEWTFPHNGGITGLKSLTWEAVKFQDRFVKFHDKVVHFILDDLDMEQVKTVENYEQKLFAAEGYQEKQRWERIVEWNNITRFFTDQDFIGFGDTDEIASRGNINRLKKCQIVSSMRSVDIGIWFIFGAFDKVFRTDYPVRGNKWTLGDPTFWTFGAAYDFHHNHKVPSRKRGTSGVSLIGGVHMTKYGFLAFQLNKRFSCTECRINSQEMKKLVAKLKYASETEGWASLEHELQKVNSDLAKRQQDIGSLSESVRKELEYYPWFYLCNKDRYPTFIGMPDTRTVAIN